MICQDRLGTNANETGCRRDACFPHRCHLYIKTIILPKQARDKHRENSKKDAVFRTAAAIAAAISLSVSLRSGDEDGDKNEEEPTSFFSGGWAEPPPSPPPLPPLAAAAVG
jgi:hypothetical protein